MVRQQATANAPGSQRKFDGSLFVGYASSPFRYRLARAATAVGVSRAGRAIGLASREPPNWRGVGHPTVFGQEANDRTMPGLLSQLTLACNCR